MIKRQNKRVVELDEPQLPAGESIDNKK